MLPSLRDARSASEYPKSIGDWLELDYFRRRRLLRRIRGPIGWVVLLGTAVLLAGLTLLPGRREIYQASPVSTAHAMFNSDCEACHDNRFGSARRLLRGDDAVRSVSDAACRRCHSGETHHARQVGPSHCAGCHHEHRGSATLVRVGDEHCTVCHGDLASHVDRTRPADSDRAFRDVESFLGGPSPHPPFVPVENTSTIEFDHRVHMNPRGLPVPGWSERRLLQCNTCHTPEPDRRYMRPIRYESHCRECHPMPARIFAELADDRAREEAERFRARPAPHPMPGEDAGAVRALLRDRYLEFARRFPTVYQQPSAVASGPASSILGPKRAGSDRRLRFESAWAERELRQAERLLFEGAGGCRYCHQAQPGAGQAVDRLPRYAPAGIRTRWFPHSVFSHDSHRSLACLECHQVDARFDLKVPDERTRAGKMLMPAIESCQKCHQGQGRGARADCVECHLYHTPGKERNRSENLTIDAFLRGLGGPPETERPPRPQRGR